MYEENNFLFRYRNELNMSQYSTILVSFLIGKNLKGLCHRIVILRFLPLKAADSSGPRRIV
jgi:hypothetical protein